MFPNQFIVINTKKIIGVAIFYLCLFFVFFESTTFATMKHKNQISDNVAVKILVGEAANQDLKGMICVGEVIRHRNSVKGFCGYKSKHIMTEPKAIWKMAENAWELSAHTNYTKGADHFENIHEFGIPWWAKDCVKMYEYKDHVFYKEVYYQ